MEGKVEGWGEPRSLAGWERGGVKGTLQKGCGGTSETGDLRRYLPTQETVRECFLDADPGELAEGYGVRGCGEMDDAVAGGAAGLGAWVLAPAGDQHLVLLADQVAVQLALDRSEEHTSE